MPGGLLTERRRRVPALGAVIMALVFVAVAVTVWRCAVAVSRSGAAAGGVGGAGTQAARAAAASAAGQALWAAVAAAALVLAALAAFAWYLARPPGRTGGQADGSGIPLAQHGGLFAEVCAATEVLGEVAAQIRARAGEAVAATAQMSKAVAETSATMERLAVSAGSVADNTRAAGQAAQQVQDTMRDMHQQADSIVTDALSLGRRTSEISEILELIKQFTGQTNLLALNAAIEAARAGDAGRGFAVVAGEVRQLAQRSIQSTGSIGAIIAAVQDEASKMITATGTGARQADQVGELMASTAAMLDESVLAARQQKSATDQVDAALQQIRAATEQLAIGQQLRFGHAERLEALVRNLDAALNPAHPGGRGAASNGRSAGWLTASPATEVAAANSTELPVTAGGSGHN